MSAWHWPQWVMLISIAVAVLIGGPCSGSKRGANYAIAHVTLWCTLAAILWAGGFWG